MNCKKCGAPILSGSYCNKCESQRNRKAGNVIKTIFGIVGVVLSILGGKFAWDRKHSKK